MTISSRLLILVLGPIALIALLAGAVSLPASAQNVPKYGDPEKEKSATEKAAEKEAEKAYQRSLGNIPAQKNVDPWGTVRSDDAPPKAAKASTVKPKTTTAKTDPTKSADSKSGGAAK